MNRVENEAYGGEGKDVESYWKDNLVPLVGWLCAFLEVGLLCGKVKWMIVRRRDRFDKFSVGNKPENEKIATARLWMIYGWILGYP